ncbi:MAG TPA: hypothetical protein VMY34_01040 [Acidimicrobiales bacterium]|nr:hypothetical protein [Acidimicrobiales bacterium]
MRSLIRSLRRDSGERCCFCEHPAQWVTTRHEVTACAFHRNQAVEADVAEESDRHENAVDWGRTLASVGRWGE